MTKLHDIYILFYTSLSLSVTSPFRFLFTPSPSLHRIHFLFFPILYGTIYTFYLLIFLEKIGHLRGAVWFDLGGKNSSNRNIKKHVVWFGSVDFKNKIRTKSNQTNAVWVGAIFLNENSLFPTLKSS